MTIQTARMETSGAIPFRRTHGSLEPLPCAWATDAQMESPKLVRYSFGGSGMRVYGAVNASRATSGLLSCAPMSGSEIRSEPIVFVGGALRALPRTYQPRPGPLANSSK